MSDNLSFLTGTNAEYIAHLYAQYQRNPASVDSSWKQFFSDLNDEEVSILKELHGASWTPEENRREANAFKGVDVTTDPVISNGNGQALPSQDVRQATLDSIRAIMLIRAYRARGHLVSDLDPLGLRKEEYHPELDPSHYGFQPSDYDRPIFIDGVLGLETANLSEIVQTLKETYCG